MQTPPATLNVLRLPETIDPAGGGDAATDLAPTLARPVSDLPGAQPFVLRARWVHDDDDQSVCSVARYRVRDIDNSDGETLG